jgi:hypothetical protein
MDRVQNTGTVDRSAEALVGAQYESPSTNEQRNRGELIKANSAVDTQVLVNSGKLPVVQIDSGSEQLAEKAKSSSEQNSCDTTYTHADWQADKLALSKALDKANEALTNKDIQAFKEFFGDPHLSPEVRQEFIKRNGVVKIERAFGEDSTNRKLSEEHQDALEYAYHGKLTVTTQIARQEGFWGLNESGVEDALKSMSPEEQAIYHQGKEIVSTNNYNVVGEEKEALKYYNKVNSSLNHASSYSIWGLENSPDFEQVAKWESLIKPQPTLEPKPLEICEVQKTSVKARQQSKFEEQELNDQRAIEQRKIELEKREALEDSYEKLLKKIPDMVRDASADGYRAVVVLNLGRAEDLRNQVYGWSNTNDYSNQPLVESYSDSAELSPEHFVKPLLDDLQKKVYDHLLAQGLKPYFLLREQLSHDQYGNPVSIGRGDWNLVARW